MADNDAEVLLAEGQSLTLVHQITGEPRTVQVRYPARALRQLERHYQVLDPESGDVIAGGLKRMGGALFDLTNQPQGVTETATRFLASGLLHEPDLSEDALLDWWTLRDLPRIMTAVRKAIAEALPTAEVPDAEGADPNPPGTDQSRGNGSTASPPSSSDAVIASSGMR